MGHRRCRHANPGALLVGNTSDYRGLRRRWQANGSGPTRFDHPAATVHETLHTHSTEQELIDTWMALGQAVQWIVVAIRHG